MLDADSCRAEAGYSPNSQYCVGRNSRGVQNRMFEMTMTVRFTKILLRLRQAEKDEVVAVRGGKVEQILSTEDDRSNRSKAQNSKFRNQPSLQQGEPTTLSLSS